MKINFCNFELDNPLILAAGILGTDSKIIHRVLESGAGGATTKSIGPFERFGNNNPTVIDFGHGLINAVGLPTGGIDNMTDEIKNLIDKPVIVSVYGNGIEDFVQVTRKVAELKPKAIELDISCPNKKGGMLFSQDPEITFKLVSECKKVAGDVSIIPKLSANVTDIISIGKACEKAGADAVCAINTISGMVINIEAKKPVLSYKKGGISGPAIKPIAVRCVYDLYENIKIPIIGTGGVTTGEDAIEMIMAGATLVGIGSAVYYNGITVFEKILNEINKWLLDNKTTIDEIRGIAHDT